MIVIRKHEGSYDPAVVCDECGGVIDDAFSATVVSSHAPEGTAAQPFHVHKGACDAALARRVGGLSGSEELAVHLVQLMRNTLQQSDPAGVKALLDGEGVV